MDLYTINSFFTRPLEYPIALMPIIFIFGAMVGSFLNVCIYRMPLEKSLWWPGSHCGYCFQPVKKADNLPLLSYWFLKGRCRRYAPAVVTIQFLLRLFALVMSCQSSHTV